MERSLFQKRIYLNEKCFAFILWLSVSLCLVYLVFVTRQVKSKASPIRTVFFASITVNRMSPYSIAWFVENRLS